MNEILGIGIFKVPPPTTQFLGLQPRIQVYILHTSSKKRN